MFNENLSSMIGIAESCGVGTVKENGEFRPDAGKVITLGLDEVGGANTVECHIISPWGETPFTVSIDLNVLPEDSDFVCAAVGRFVIHAEDYDSYMELVRSQKEDDALFDDASPSLFDDDGEETAWNKFIDIQEQMATVLKPLAETKRLRLKMLQLKMKVNSLKYGFKGDVHVARKYTVCGLNVKVFSTWYPGVCTRLKKAADRVRAIDTRLATAKAGDFLPKDQFMGLVAEKKSINEAIKANLDVRNSLDGKIAQKWDEIHNAEAVLDSELRWNVRNQLKAEAMKVQGDRTYFFPKFMEAADETISPYLTLGEVDPEIDDRQIWDENLDQGDALSESHLKQMLSDGMLAWQDQEPVREEDMPTTKPHAFGLKSEKYFVKASDESNTQWLTDDADLQSQMAEIDQLCVVIITDVE